MGRREHVDVYVGRFRTSYDLFAALNDGSAGGKVAY